MKRWRSHRQNQTQNDEEDEETQWKDCWELYGLKQWDEQRNRLNSKSNRQENNRKKKERDSFSLGSKKTRRRRSRVGLRLLWFLNVLLFLLLLLFLDTLPSSHPSSPFIPHFNERRVLIRERERSTIWKRQVCVCRSQMFRTQWEQWSSGQGL